MNKFLIKELDKYYEPFSTYTLFKTYKDSVFLDSSKEDENLSKFSFIGVNPILKFKSYGKTVYINDEIKQDVDPFSELENVINKYKYKVNSNLPFVGGAIGYFSYDIGRVLEKLPNTSKEDFIIPDSLFRIYENIIIFDLINKKTYISSLGFKDNSIEEILENLKKYKIVEEKKIIEKNNEFISNFSKKEYEKAIENLKNYIKSGDVYIANMTRRVLCESEKPSFEIYEDLRSINKAPFSSYINYEDFQIISSSPERFLSIVNNKVITRPIKGTRPRGGNKEEDEKNKLELVNSEKDKAELLMIVDLERNDLSKVCKPHSVKVTELFKIEKYATVFHLVSTIEGELEKGISSVKCMKECFPGGSITGAPKIRAMEVIEELEGLKRNLYTGSIGYFDIRGNCDFNIVIRSIIKKEGRAYFGVGGGITYDSNPEEEWFETIDKAKALMKVL